MYLTIPEPGTANLQLYDQNGRLLRGLFEAENLSRGIHELNYNRRDLSAGMYFLRLNALGQIKTIKLIIQD